MSVSPKPRLAISLLPLLLTACAITPPGQQSPPATADPRPSTAPTPPAPVVPDPKPQATQPVPEPEPRCAWSQVRGIATLLSLGSAMANPELATWEFVPGGDVLFHPAPDGSQPGDEFKALLERPLNGPCPRARLYLVAPLPGH
ncbi:hypothetical protein [Marinobacter xestospongiae]|uniref:Uncharacterized protein n=1 Tax=Marinobacter xestospongiae TaxID=994319 RepID=A0ABU3VVW3_9GAMM|nr:hypothetical protein [Marinobacter xestospongiae]MDV2078412.1 hypothetical protein [Marinobacter xestospongiae]